MIRGILLLHFFIVGCACQTPGGSEEDCYTRLDLSRNTRLKSWMKALTDNKEVAGAVYMVQSPQGDHWTHTVGYRDRGQEIDIQPTDIFRAGELAQPIIAAAFMLLVEQGKASLTDTVSRWLPEFKHMMVLDTCNGTEEGCVDGYKERKAKTEITIHHLLLHTSGIANDAFMELLPNPSFDVKKVRILAERYKWFEVDTGCKVTLYPLKELVQRLAKVPLLADPGVTYQPGLSMDVIARIIEIITKQPLDQFVQINIFEPLGMEDSAFWVPPTANKDNVLKRERVVQYYYRSDTPTLHSTEKLMSAEAATQQVKDYVDTITAVQHKLHGSCGLVTTPEDFMKFLSMITQRGRVPASMVGDRMKVLSPTSVDWMTHNHLPRDIIQHNTSHWKTGEGRGYGFDIGPSDPVDLHIPTPLAYLHGSSIHNTFFYIDPIAHISAIFFTQTGALFGDRHVDWSDQLAVHTAQMLDEVCLSRGDNPAEIREWEDSDVDPSLLHQEWETDHQDL